MKIYTIGHSVYKLDRFIELLTKYDIDLVLDVRSTPYSKHVPHFNENQIKGKLEDEGICYKFVGDSFGARQKDPNLYSEDGILDFNKVRMSSKFKNTFNKVMDNINGANIVLMCGEKDPIKCHRSILISNAFSKKGVTIHHILVDEEGNDYIETQDDLENRLLKFYGFTRKTQETLDYLFNKNSDIDYVEKAYEKRNKDIGYCRVSK